MTRNCQSQPAVKLPSSVITVLRVVAIVAALLVSAAIVRAQEDGTPAQRKACRPDVFRLCGVYVPRPGPITRCLERNIDRLSEPCRAVFEGRLR